MGQDAVWTPLSRMHRRQQIGYIAYLVRDYDEAIVFFTQTLCFNLVEDTDLGGGKRWVWIRMLHGAGHHASAVQQVELLCLSGRCLRLCSENSRYLVGCAAGGSVLGGFGRRNLLQFHAGA